MSKHTPGPWFIAQTELWSASPYKFGVQVVADLHQSSHMEANAHLIAAAPDLLSALEAILSVPNIAMHPEYYDAVAAIAKARAK